MPPQRPKIHLSPQPLTRRAVGKAPVHRNDLTAPNSELLVWGPDPEQNTRIRR